MDKQTIIIHRAMALNPDTQERHDTLPSYFKIPLNAHS